MLTCAKQYQLNFSRIRATKNPPHSSDLKNLVFYLSFWAEANDVLTPIQHHFHHCEQSEGVFQKIDMRLMLDKGSPLISQKEKLAAAILSGSNFPSLRLLRREVAVRQVELRRASWAANWEEERRATRALSNYLFPTPVPATQLKVGHRAPISNLQLDSPLVWN